VNKPEVFVSFVSQKFDDKGRLLDEKTKELIKELLDNLVAWAKRLKIA
jgi:chromate reductase